MVFDTVSRSYVGPWKPWNDRIWPPTAVPNTCMASIRGTVRAILANYRAQIVGMDASNMMFFIWQICISVKTAN